MNKLELKEKRDQLFAKTKAKGFAEFACFPEKVKQELNKLDALIGDE
jgi:hypothetical protein